MNKKTPEDGASPERLAYLDSIRGIAALVVVLHHCWLALAPDSLRFEHSLSAALASSNSDVILYGLAKVFDTGRSAVIVFFVLSGFVLTCSLAARPTPYVTYAIKRFFRIYPAFLFVILASYGLHRLIGIQHEPGSVFLKRVRNPDLSFIVLVRHLLMVGTMTATGWTELCGPSCTR